MIQLKIEVFVTDRTKDSWSVANFHKTLNNYFDLIKGLRLAKKRCKLFESNSCLCCIVYRFAEANDKAKNNSIGYIGYNCSINGD